MLNIKKILIANRAEIASRIQFTCKSLGIQTVAVYAPQDKFMPYVYQADQNYALSLDGSAAYLNQDEIIKIALDCNANAIHPGYGFLSENSQFAQKVIDAGLIWIGPSPKSIELMGDKICAREIMQKADIPIIPGIYILHENKNAAKNFADGIGYPVILKDPQGGGGKAIRKVETQQDFDGAWERVKSEAQKHTGSTQILVEKYIKNGRHIEIQIAGDGQKFIHLFERECSIQRRHQKIIEETPCNFLSKQTLEKMYNAAISAAKITEYQNIGTVEFIVTPEENFYFLEMNTRLQVEHGVTEMTTGIDLVALQIEIAQTKKLELKQQEITQNCHAVQCRIYAEDPENNFIPSTGIIKNLQLPNGPFIRHDHNLEENMEITPFFDPMLSKLIAFGKNRNFAIKNMLVALEQLNISGLHTNVVFLKKILLSQEFLSGKIHTQLLNDPEYMQKLLDHDSNIDFDLEKISRIAVELFSQALKKEKNNTQQNLPLNNWKNQKWQ